VGALAVLEAQGRLHRILIVGIDDPFDVARGNGFAVGPDLDHRFRIRHLLKQDYDIHMVLLSSAESKETAIWKNFIKTWAGASPERPRRLLWRPERQSTGQRHRPPGRRRFSNPGQNRGQWSV